MKGLWIVDEGQAFSLGFSLFNTTSPKLRLQPLHQTDSHLILDACRGVIELGRSINRISLSKVLECDDISCVCES